MIDWKKLGAEYAETHEDSEVAFDAARSNDSVWDMWEKLNSDDQERASNDFASAFVSRLAEIVRNEIIEELKEIVTPAEVELLGWAKADTVRDACENKYIAARKSGATWLMFRKDAQRRWCVE